MSTKTVPATPNEANQASAAALVDRPSWLSVWEPEIAEFWNTTGKGIAWRTLIITTFNLLLAFATWFMVSVIVVRLPDVGFQLSTSQSFWLAAMPGLAGGSLRIVHTFLIPIFGTRHTIAAATMLLLLPCVGWGLAVQSPSTPYWVLLLLALLAGLGGGNFSSFMPSTSLFFPKRLQGTALGIQAGVGNFGVSVAQFLIPWLVGFALFGSLAGAAQKPGLWLQNAAFVWMPFIILGAVLAWCFLKSVPVRASLGQQLDIFRDKHTWLMTSLYMMTFGSFSGYSATFALLTREVYSKDRFGPDAPNPLALAFLGPLVGAASRVLCGPLSDRYGGALVTQISGIGLVACALGAAQFTEPASMAQFPWFVAFMLGLFFFAGVGNASTFKQMPMIFPPRQAGGVIGWTSAVAAYGPFLFSALFGVAIGMTGAPTVVFYGAAVFYLLNCGINWWYYLRPGAEKPC